jgi:hypothetical protein
VAHAEVEPVVAGKLGELALGLPLDPQVVLLEECDEVPSGQGETGSAGGSRTAVLAPMVTDRIVEATDDVGRRVGGAVVHHDDLQRTMGLRQDACEALLEKARPIEARHDARYQWRQR